jgi:putrescine---pyruvate transaminase
MTSPLWHPFSDMGAVADDKLVLARGDGIWVEDESGRRYMDATASLWCANLGHGRKEITRAVAQQLGTLDTFNIFGDYANRPALDLAQRLAALSPMPETKIVFGSGGGDALDAAAKIARAHFAHRGQPQRTHLISRTLGYHGTHGMGTSLAGIEANGTGWGRLVPDVSVVPFNDANALEAEILRVGAERVAAFFCEPVIGAGGVHLPPAGYIEHVAEICARHGVLLVADCVICGFGRLGTWFGIDRWPVQPDMIAVAKGITSGTMPLGALLVSGAVAEPWFTQTPGAPVLRHGQTYAGHPVCCAAGLATIDLLEREELIGRGRELEEVLEQVLTPFTEHSLVQEVRAGLGLMAAVDLTEAALTSIPGAVGGLQRQCRDAGVLVRPLLRGIAVSPPLVITESDLELMGSLVADGLAGFERLTDTAVAVR